MDMVTIDASFLLIGVFFLGFFTASFIGLIMDKFFGD